jgi:hypothetical protein
MQTTKLWTIRAFALQRTLEFGFRGFWTIADAEEWRKVYFAHVDHISGECNGKFFALVDFTGYPAQRQEVANVHAACMAYARSKGLERAAHIVPDVIAKMQMDKLGNRIDNTRFANFLTRAEATAWLRHT